ncbi:glycosyltransferase [bacterium]|nr:glycosyltransferase [bacterium]
MANQSKISVTADDVLAISAFNDAGATHHETACRYLAGQGLRVRWICVNPVRWPSSVWPSETFMADPRPRSSTTLGKLAWQTSLTAHIARLAWNHQGVIYVCGSYATPAIYPLLPFLSGKTIFYHTQDYLEPSHHPGRSRIERAVCRRARFVFVNETNRGRFLQSNYGLSETPITIPTALPLDWPVARRSSSPRRFGQTVIEEGAISLLHLGGYATNRCTPTLLEALGRLGDRYRLIFTGSPPGSPSEKQITDHAGRLGIQRQIITLPYLAYADVFQLIADADLGILLYPNDGVGNFYQSPGRLTEFAASGIPIVTSRFPGLENLLFKHSIGTCADPTSPDDLATAIRAAIEAHPPSPATHERIRSIFRKELAYEVHGERLLAPFRQALSENNDR